MKSIGEMLTEQKWQVDSYSQQDALEEVIKTVKAPGLLHIATHGFFEPNQQEEHRKIRMSAQLSGLEDPMLRSGLYFAGADRARFGAAPTVAEVP